MSPDPTPDRSESPGEVELIRLTVPAAPDFVQVVRIAVRVVAGRAGCSDDARSRLQAAVGAAYFEVVDRSPADASVVAELATGDGRVTVTLSGEPPGAALDPTTVAGLADGHDVIDEGHRLRLWVGC